MRLILFIFMFALFASVVGDMRHTQERLRTYSTGVASEFDRCVAQAYKYDTNPERCID